MDIMHPIMNDGVPSETWSDDLAVLETFDRPVHVSWANRNRPTTPPRDPWNGPIEEFLDYLTGTSTAPGVVTMSRVSSDAGE